MKAKFKIITIITICFYLYNLQIVKADGLDRAGDALIEILYKGCIMLFLIICSLVLIDEARLNWILKLLLVIWTFYTPLVYINDSKPYSFNMRERLGDLIIHPYGWIIITLLLIILIGVNKLYNYSERN